MTIPTINNKPVENPDALEGLDNILKSTQLQPLQDGNSDFSDEELGDILDISDPNTNWIDREDIAHHTARNTGLTEKQFVALAREYHARFPGREKKVSISIWGNANILAKPAITRDEYVERMRRDIGEKRQLFIRDLRFLRDMGVELNPVPTIAILGESGIDWACDGGKSNFACLRHRDMRNALRNAKGDGKFELIDSDNLGFFDKAILGDLSPEKFLDQQSVPFLESGRVFLDPKAKVNFLTTTVNVSMDGDTYWISAWDWMSGEPFFVKNYPVRKMDMAGISADLDEAIKRHSSELDPKNILKKITPLTKEERAELDALAVYRLNHPEGWSNVDIKYAGKSWEEFSDTFHITLEGRAFRADVDRESRQPLISSDLNLTLTDKAMGALENRALEINGFLEMISLVITDEDVGLELAEDPRLRWDYRELYRDKYGNLIEPSYGFHLATGKPYFMGFSIYPCYPLSGDPESSPVQTIGVDLTRFGFGDHPKLLTVQSLAPLRMPNQANPYFLYSTLPAVDSTRADGVYEKAAQLAARAEEAFGFKPGERIKDIFLVPSSSWNASVRFANPTAFFIWDELFNDVLEGKADFVIPHEASHNFDAQFGFSFEPGFIGLFERLKEAADNELFNAIDEKNFLAAGKGGHSKENVFEFFATLTNTITAPNWSEKVEKMTPRVRGLYYHALCALKKALVTKRPSMTSAPIFRRLNERILALESRASPYPPLEELAQKPVSQLLAESTVPVRAIKAKDFAKEVLQEKGPVVVVFYQEGISDDIPFIRSAQASFGNRSKVVAMSLQEGDPLMSKFFDGTISTQGVFIFMHGKLMARISHFDDCRTDEEVISKTIQWLDYLDYLRPSPIPIIGPLIDLVRQW